MRTNGKLRSRASFNMKTYAWVCQRYGEGFPVWTLKMFWLCLYQQIFENPMIKPWRAKARSFLRWGILLCVMTVMVKWMNDLRNENYEEWVKAWNFFCLFVRINSTRTKARLHGRRDPIGDNFCEKFRQTADQSDWTIILDVLFWWSLESEDYLPEFPRTRVCSTQKDVVE